MGLINKKSPVVRVLESVADSLEVPSGVKKATPKPGKRAGTALKAGAITAGGAAGLTAASAAISSLRRRKEGARNDS